MIGRTTLLWLALAMLVVFGLFHVKYQVAALEEELVRLNAATLREQSQIHVLEAEWSYLNRPSRLEELAERHLALKPLATQQLTAIATLPVRPARNETLLNDPATVAKVLPLRKPPLEARTAPTSVPAASAATGHAFSGTATPVGLALESPR